jgi:hypothetical protein
MDCLGHRRAEATPSSGRLWASGSDAVLWTAMGERKRRRPPDGYGRAEATPSLSLRHPALIRDCQGSAAARICRRCAIPVQPEGRTPGPCPRASPPAAKVHRRGGQRLFSLDFPWAGRRSFEKRFGLLVRGDALAQFSFGLMPKFVIPTVGPMILFPELMRANANLFFCGLCHGRCFQIEARPVRKGTGDKGQSRAGRAHSAR